MFVTPAYAQAAGSVASSTNDMLMQMLPIVLIVLVFYFFLLRPQAIKAKQTTAMLAALQKGDEIVTSGGVIGKVFRIVDSNEVLVEIAEGVRVRVVRSTISYIYKAPDAPPPSAVIKGS